MPGEEELLEELRSLRKKLMPPSQQVVQETWLQLGYDGVPETEVRLRFNEMLRHLFQETLTVLEVYEQKVDVEQVLPNVVLKNSALAQELQDALADSTSDVLIRFLKTVHPLLKGYYQSISQSRKQRGGKDFEYQIQMLLQSAGIPHEVQTKRERSDFILPSVTLLKADKPKAVLMSVKRTLRERWQQVVNELQLVQCPNTYLATAELEVGPNALEGIWARNIYLLVWDELKKTQYADQPAVKGYSEFMDLLTSHFLPQWA